MIERIREAARAALPPGANVLVVSKGDPALLELSGARAQHFPQGLRGEWAGYHPASSSDALLHLEELRKRGAEYLVLPRTAYWWLSHYGALAEYLEEHCSRVPTSGDECRIFALGARSADPRRSSSGGYSDEGQRIVQLEAFLDSLLPEDARVAVIGASSLEILRPRARVVERLAIPETLEPGDDEPFDPDALDIPGEGVDYVVVARHRDGPSDIDASIVERLRATGRLLAHRKQLGWLFDMKDPPARRAPLLTPRARREESP